MNTHEKDIPQNASYATFGTETPKGVEKHVCDVCGGHGETYRWEAVQCGSLNCYYHTTCKDCDHSDTNDIFYD